jgi:hypothetical protein
MHQRDRIGTHQVDVGVYFGAMMPHLRTTCLSRSLVLTSNSTLCHVYFGTLIAGSARPPARPATPPKSVATPPRRTAPTPPPARVLRVPEGTLPSTAALMAARQAPAPKAPRKTRVSPESPPLLPAFPFPDRGRLLLPLLLPPPLLVRGTGGDWAGSSGGARSVPVAGSNVQPDGRRGGTSPARYSCRM